MVLESDEHPDRVRVGGQGSSMTSYFHTRQSRRSHTDEEIERKAEATFEARWKVSEAIFEKKD